MLMEVKVIMTHEYRNKSESNIEMKGIIEIEIKVKLVIKMEM